MIETPTFAFCTYDKTLYELRTALGGLPFDCMMFINGVKMLDDVIVDSCPNVNKQSENFTRLLIDFIYKLTLLFCPQFYP